MVACMLRICAAAATPWAWLPDENATTPPLRSVLRDRGQLVEGAAELERSGPLQHFRLQKDLGPDAFVENGERQQRRPHRKGRNHPRRRIDIRGSDWCH